MLKRGLWLLVRGFLVLTSISVAASLPTDAAAQQRTAAFEPAECMFEFPVINFISPDLVGVECGYVTVPERHANPNGPTIRLAVAVLPAQGEAAAPDPLFMAQGGPGGSSLELFPFLMLGSPIRSKRDIVIFDQRGTFYSEPNLLCPELDTLSKETIGLNLSQEEEDALALETYQACRARLEGEGLDLAAYNSLENAADIEAVRIALGYDEINFYGVSYGTLLALHYMRNHPTSLRAAILDAVVPAQGSFLAQAAVTADRAFKEIAQLCTQDANCQANYPNLEDMIYELMATLNDDPAIVSITEPGSGQRFQAAVDGDLFINTLFLATYDPTLLPTLPALVYNTHSGNYDQLSSLLPLLIFQPKFSIGMYQTVICAEEADFDPEEIPAVDVRPELASLMKADNKFILDVCQLWQIPKLGPEVNAPVVSDVPTLLLSGRFDPITPPARAETAARTLRNGYTVTFPNTSHGSFIANACANRIVLDFLDNPQRSPRADCLSNQAANFNIPTPATVMMTPAISNILRTIEAGDWGRVGLLLLSLLFLLSFFLVWPLAFLWRTLNKIPPSQNQPGIVMAWVAPALVAAAGSVSLLFLVGLVTLAIVVDPAALLVGVPWRAAPLFILPLLLLLLAVGLLVMTCFIWVKGFWPVWQRAYYSLLTLSALIFVVILARWEMLTVFL